MSAVIIIPPGLELIGGEVQYRHTYTCQRCGARGRGDTRRCDVHELGSQRIRAHAMPVGWASRYAPAADYFTCPGCHE